MITQLSIVVQWTEDWTVLMESVMAANMAIRSGLEPGRQSQVCMERAGDIYEVTREDNIVVVERVLNRDGMN